MATPFSPAPSAGSNAARNACFDIAHHPGVFMTYIEIFEHLHENPELSLEEFETTAFIKKFSLKKELKS